VPTLSIIAVIYFPLDYDEYGCTKSGEVQVKFADGTLSEKLPINAGTVVWFAREFDSETWAELRKAMRMPKVWFEIPLTAVEGK
jgi:hypothetical protein